MIKAKKNNKSASSGKKVKECCVCSNRKLVRMLSLPSLPLTGLFSKKPMTGDIKGIDQKLMFCPCCGHGQLDTQIDPTVLYDHETYSFKSSLSATTRQGTKFFLDFLKKIAGGRVFNCVLDVGCNDLYLLKEMEGLAKTRIGIDPIWSSQKPQDPSIIVIGGTVEGIDLKKALPCKPDLVVCRHTIEHISDPFGMINKLVECADEDCIFLFETPAFESLVEEARFDHVFHEHLQYFSLGSFGALLERCGAEPLASYRAQHGWGVMLIAFKKKKNMIRNAKIKGAGSAAKTIKQKCDWFKAQMENVSVVLKGLNDGPVYGYGAALMLPVLAYHLKSDLSFFKGIIDDDLTKDGMYYANLPLMVRHSSKISDFERSTVFITALDNIVPIMGRLMSNRPRKIIYPFFVIS